MEIEEISEKYNATRPQTPIREVDNFWRKIGEKKNVDVVSQETASQEFSTKELATIIEKAHNQNTFEMNTSVWKMSVASNEEIQRDTETLIETDSLLLINSPFSKNLSIRAISGHAQNGHCTFISRKQNTDPDAVLRGLEGNSIEGLEDITLEGFKNESQETIDDIVYFVEDYFQGILKDPSRTPQNPPRKILTRNGKPIGGLTFLKEQEIDMIEFMRGFYFASLMDNHDDIRSQVKNIYRFEMGGGDTFPVDINALMKYGVNIDHLTGKKPAGLLRILHCMTPHEGTELLTELGIIKPQIVLPREIDPSKQDWESIKQEYAVDLIKNPNLKNQYMRYYRGLGCSDDIAIFLSSYLPKTFSSTQGKNAEISRFIGALLADKIDTLEKNARFLFSGGQDETIGQYFNQLFREACKRSAKFRERFDIDRRQDEQYQLLPRRTIVDFTAASANKQDEIIHSSQRWLYKNVERTCALSEYVKQVYATTRYLGGKTPSDTEIKRIYGADMTAGTPPINLTFKQVPLEKITKAFRERRELISSPSDRERKLTQFYLD